MQRSIDQLLNAFDAGHALPVVAGMERLRAALLDARARNIELDSMRAGLQRIAATAERMATGEFRSVPTLEGESADLDAALVCLSMLGEELEHQQRVLTQARDDARAASVAKSGFLANMSHELRTPLNVIIGYCELMQEEVAYMMDGVGLSADLTRVLSAATHLLQLVSDVLDLSRIEAGRLEVSTRSVRLQPILHDVCVSMNTASASRVVCDPTEFVVRADPIRLKQVLLNLIGNALKFSDQPVHLRVLSAGPQVKISVQDHGIGIAPDRLQAIFEPFVQETDSTHRRYGGTGLGLAISHRLCAMMGGDLQVESRVGVGSVFTVVLVSADEQASIQTDRGQPGG